jgi:hypothetical protein
VAVVVLNWNGRSDTLECLNSLYRSTYGNIDVIVVDNGSTDCSVSAVRQSFPHIKIVENNNNLGYAEGNNVGIRHAVERGADYVLVLNNDAVIDPLAIQKLVLSAEMRSDAGVFSPKIYWYSRPKVVWFAGAKWSASKAGFDHLGSGQSDDGQGSAMAYDIDSASGCALFFRAKLVFEVGLFDPRFFLTWEETDWCYRARRCGYRVMLEPGARVWHKVSSSFGSDWQSPLYQYYFTRNRLLWIERNLRGRERIHAFARCLRELNWWRVGLSQAGKTENEYAVLRARLRGDLDYFLRRFGKGSCSIVEYQPRVVTPG